MVMGYPAVPRLGLRRKSKPECRLFPRPHRACHVECEDRRLLCPSFPVGLVFFNTITTSTSYTVYSGMWQDPTFTITVVKLECDSSILNLAKTTCVCSG